MDILKKFGVVDGWPLAVFSAVHTSAYLATCLWWAYAACRPARAERTVETGVECARAA
jgi:hypothetical protein